MDGFLSDCARQLYRKYGPGISDLHMIFPSRRAALFFNNALSEIADRPLWQPRTLSIDAIAEQISGLKNGDRIRLVTELFRIYSKFHPQENFDSFYYWGEMLIADFDAIDKYMIDARMLLANLSELRELDRADYLTEEQKQIIRRFWQSFADREHLSRQQSQFIDIWQTLYPIYSGFKERLAEQGIAYSGMMYRCAAEKIVSGEEVALPQRKYAIIGFNALSVCEKKIFDFLRRSASVDFFWDYDDYYLDNTAQEAGTFIRENIKLFPPAAVPDGGTDNFLKPKVINCISAPSSVMQCKYVHGFLEEIRSQSGKTPDRETAIILTDENLLRPLLYSLPESIEQINITMGYPLRGEVAYSLLERLIELQNRRKTRGGSTVFYHSDVCGLLAHPLVAEQDRLASSELLKKIKQSQSIYVSDKRLAVTPMLEKIFSPHEGWQELSAYLTDIIKYVAQHTPPSEDKHARTARLEILGLIAENIAKTDNSIAACGIEISTKTYASLLRRMLQNITVPFEGMPLEGLQIMGFLETRALDFKNIVILSMNDDNCPGNRSTSPSFIPYGLRMAYGLPTPEHQESMYAYYFARLIQRAQRIDLVYCSTSDDKSSGEPSRYIHQLDFESPHKVNRREITVRASSTPIQAINVVKTLHIMAQLQRYTKGGDRKMSPTQFFKFVECPLKFYLSAIAAIKVPDELSEEVDNAMFGTILHYAMEKLYTPLVGKPNVREKIPGITSEQISQAVNEAIRTEYFGGESVAPSDWNGNLILVGNTITQYIAGSILPFDSKTSDDFLIEALECEVGSEYTFECPDGPRTIVFTGKADRLDRGADGSLRIIDYKTGAPKGDTAKIIEKFESVEALFKGKADERISAVLQTLLYSMMFSKQQDCAVTPMLYYVRNMNRDDYSPLIEDKNLKQPVRLYSEYAAEFERHLSDTLREMFDPDTSFSQCDDEKPCQWCDYKNICKR